MTTIAGASQFLNASTLANQRGNAAAAPNVLGTAEGATSLLDVGRSSLFDNGIGLSASARALNNSFIESNSATFNEIFSLGVGANATVEGLQQEILALRGRFSDDQLAPSLRQDTGEVAASETGQEVDTEA